MLACYRLRVLDHQIKLERLRLVMKRHAPIAKAEVVIRQVLEGALVLDRKHRVQVGEATVTLERQFSVVIFDKVKVQVIDGVHRQGLHEIRLVVHRRVVAGEPHHFEILVKHADCPRWLLLVRPQNRTVHSVRLQSWRLREVNLGQHACRLYLLHRWK